MEKLNHHQVYSWTALAKFNLPLKRFVKENSKVGLERLASNDFHPVTYVEGYTFELIPNTNKFRVFDNDFSRAKVWRFTTIRNIEWEIQRLESYIWTLKFEYSKSEAIQTEELRLEVLKCRLVEVLRGGVLV